MACNCYCCLSYTCSKLIATLSLPSVWVSHYSVRQALSLSILVQLAMGLDYLIWHHLHTGRSVTVGYSNKIRYTIRSVFVFISCVYIQYSTASPKNFKFSYIFWISRSWKLPEIPGNEIFQVAKASRKWMKSRFFTKNLHPKKKLECLNNDVVFKIKESMQWFHYILYSLFLYEHYQAAAVLNV